MDKQKFDEIFAILEDSFYESEYRTYDQQKALLDKSYYNVFIKEENGKILGFIMNWTFDTFCFIDHFAISKEYRNKGLGSTILQEFISQVNVPVVLEVENDDSELSLRRIEFYKRNGFYLSDCIYMQPPFKPNLDAVELRMMSTVKLNTEEYLENKKIVFKEVYKVM